MLTTDYHIHTSFSTDATGTMEEMILAAIAKGFTEIALTDHIDHNAAYCYPTPHLIDFEAYQTHFRGLQEKYEKKIKLVLGLEIGLAPNLEEDVAQLLAQFPFAFVIGSSHDIQTQDLYLGNFFKGKTKEEAYRLYFEEVLANCRMFPAFNVYGHLDYIRRYGNYDDNSLLYEDYKEIVDEILKTLIDTGKGLEVNTSGYRYGLEQVHPQPTILKRYRQLGGEIITVGSDAHRPQDVGSHFDRAADYLREAGFKAVTVFRDRKPVWIDL